MNMKKVSVIVPAFGDTPFLADCKAALEGQTFKDFEIVVCGDGAGNAGAARNMGLVRATGEWVSFVDADDLPCPDMLAAAVEKGEAEHAGVVVFAAEEFDNRTGFVTPLPLRLGAGLGDAVRLTSFGNAVWNKLFRAEYLRSRGIRFQEIPRSNDLAFTVEAMACTDRIAVLPRTLYRYCINAGGLQSTKSATPDCWRLALAECRQRLERAGLLPRFADALAALEREVEGDNLPGGCLSPKRILHSILRRGLRGFLLHALGRLFR